MYFSKPYRTIAETHIGNAFALSPTSVSEPLAQLAQFSDRMSKSNCLGVSNISEELKIYLHGSRHFGNQVSSITPVMEDFRRSYFQTGLTQTRLSQHLQKLLLRAHIDRLRH